MYDAAAGGGTTTLVFDPDRGRLVEDYASLSGTIRNCAGGVTPSGTWLTCEETTDVIAETRHGYVFEVPAEGGASAVASKAMGRFSHEATATDPATGIVYETEDSGKIPRCTDTYRTTRPISPPAVVLEAMVLASTANTRPWTTGMSSAASWVTVDQPDPGPGEPSTSSQALAKGTARIVRGEGAWYGNGVIYVISTSGGPAGEGQVFSYDPTTATFTCVYSSPEAPSPERTGQRDGQPPRRPRAVRGRQ